MTASAPWVRMFMPPAPSSPSRENEDEAPVAVAATCSRYWPGEVCTAEATRPFPAPLMAATTSERLPLPTSIEVVVPSDAVSVSGPLATTLAVEETADAETSACAAASEVTSKVRAPRVVPLAVAVTELELEVTVVPVQVEVLASPEASVPTVPSAVESLPSASAALCCTVCWFLSRVCWFGLHRDELVDDRARVETGDGTGDRHLGHGVAPRRGRVVRAGRPRAAGRHRLRWRPAALVRLTAAA